MGGKNMIQSFSYNLKDMEMIEQAFKVARDDGISFSEYVVSLLKEDIRKKVVGTIDPLNLKSNNTYVSFTEKPLQSKKITLDQFIDKVREIQSPQLIGQLQGILKQKQQSLRRQKEVRYFQ